MNTPEQQLEALRDIRQMMKQSSRFLSLSGLSGIFAGMYALAGAWVGQGLIAGYTQSLYESGQPASYTLLLLKCIFICLAVLSASLLTAYVLSARKARRNHESLLNHTAFQLLINLLIPLAAGGVFCVAMLFHGGSSVLFVSPGMLIFYGLALLNASKYTLHDIRYLGLLQLALGLLGLFLPGYGLVMWALGFGALHVVYGGIMWFKYDRVKRQDLVK